MILFLLSLGVFGLLGVSVLCPFLAIAAYSFRAKKSGKNILQETSEIAPPLSIDILIPVHNEAEAIPATLESILKSAENIPNVNIRIGTDGCTDQTAQVVRQFAQVKVTEFSKKQSKWITIKTLLATSSADWVILVDAGTLWPQNFLSEFIRQVAKEPHAVAIAPSYRPLGAGWFPHAIWFMEASLKRIEAFCGGPISLHGATVGYKADRLKKVLDYLGETRWLNDDVVIPLVLRMLYPEGVIIYPAGHVHDAGGHHDRPDLDRRKRILLGNLQWTKTMLPDCLRLNPVAGIVATRRLFRMLWAYWLACLFVGLALTFHFLILPALASAGILATLSGSFRQFAGAAFISLLTPFLFFRSASSQEVNWK